MSDVEKPTQIMVVDDSHLVSKALAALLCAEGYEPVVFHEAKPAIDYALGNKSVQAAVIDIHLPDISGIDLAAELRNTLGERMPIIMLSGDSSIDTLRALPSAGATHFFSKPVNADRLMDFLRRCLDDTPVRT